MSHNYDELLDSNIRSIAQKWGADLVAVCPSESLYHLHGHESAIKDMMNDAKTVVIAAVRMFTSPLECSNRNIRPAQYATYCLYGVLDKIAFEISRFLDDSGYKAVSIPAFLPIKMSWETRGMIADVSLRHAAEEAGLGRIGLNRLLITKKFGPRVRITGVITDAPLNPDKKLDEEICDNCGLCINACPVSAITEDGKVDVRKCAPEILKYGLPGLIKFTRKWLETGVGEVNEMTKDPIFWELWQTSMIGTFYYCFKCITSCPIGKKE
ncbi:MAG: 4Fe-4S binding protein [Candidatus Hodarchaeota archaeon]